ncbi:uncharacterized protein MELLADRAFT_109918 [Melampsora larici-populina 98AG31]|uniref:Uncharacterized protein n=1 Tax=Melampsora larici-populina (strain 98AG31 / pathotype 3-4-7) TaxID=747676 RepID=F4RY26_MELLP|nr:uncharacterized protein MELLADRAFT_109918 [Melampsora larici-populina 98AG31]EGG02715.1 hypothetical protein MELLADRAFT_109918 [Melampsora larici-populina 98AG31]
MNKTNSDETGTTMNSFKLSDDPGPCYQAHKTIPEEKRVYPHPNLPVYYNSDDVRKVVNVKYKGQSVHPIVLARELTFNTSNERLDEDEIKELRNHLKHHYQNFRPHQIFGPAKVSHIISDPNAISNPAMNPTEIDAIPLQDIELAKIKQTPELMPNNHQDYDGFDYISYDWLQGSTAHIHTDDERSQMILTDLHFPEASASTSLNASQKETTEDVLPFNHDPSRGVIPQLVPQNLRVSGYNQSVTTGPINADLIDAIQRVVLKIKETLPTPSLYSSMAVVILPAHNKPGMDDFKSSRKLSDQSVLPPSAAFHVFHGPIGCLRIEGLTSGSLPDLISYFNSPERPPIGIQARLMGVRFVIITTVPHER